MHYYYLIFLVFSLISLVYADFRHKLFLFRLKKAAMIIMAAGLLFFLVWDATGILLDVFSTNIDWVSGAYFFTANMPLEELLFLSLFLYSTALSWRLVCLHTS